MVTQPLPVALDPDTAFDAMRVFLEAYWKRGSKTSDDIAVLLGSLERVGDEGAPLDPAMWSDWLDAIQLTATKAR